jgi:hypothetical protein
MAVSATSEPSASASLAMIQALELAGALTTFQAARLFRAWPHLEDDWAASPYFGTVREHTRAYIEQAANRARSHA